MRKWIKKQCKKCFASQVEPLIVSGRGYTEYNIWFCKVCGRVISEITKDYENLYSIETHNQGEL
jgi:hypothetical protein